MNNKSITFRLILLNFLEFAVWGAYLTSLGRYLGGIGMIDKIKWFFAMQGIVSIFMPTLMGILADRKIQAQKVLSMCHLFAGIFMIAAGLYCRNSAGQIAFGPLFTLYSISLAFLPSPSSIPWPTTPSNRLARIPSKISLPSGCSEP